MTPEAGSWYVDRSLGHEGQPMRGCFKLLVVGVDTVEVVDAFGVRRVVNRQLWERDMQKEGRGPVAVREGERA